MFKASLSDLRTEMSEGEWSARSGSVDPRQQERFVEPWSGSEGVGLWECTEGTFPSSRSGRTEVCLILSGSAEIHSDSDEPTIFVKQGDLVVLPDGWSGKWTVLETVEKVYVNILR